MKFAVIGGDMRQVKLAESLAADGHDVSAFAIDKVRIEGVKQTELVRDAVQEAHCVIFPLPMATREGLINTPLSGGLHTTREALSVLNPGQVICAGRIEAADYELADTFGLQFIDYLCREEFAVSNAVAAAEGAIQIIMEETPATVNGSSCLVIGFGRISKLLCHRLRGLGAHVTASARKYEDLAWIQAYGYKSMETAAIDDSLDEYDIVVNTVPARVLSEERLRKLKHGCLCLDLASKPGGADM